VLTPRGGNGRTVTYVMIFRGGGRAIRWTAVALVLGAAACSGAACSGARSNGQAHQARQPATEYAAGKRFTVTFSAKALNEASSAGVNVQHLVAGALDHINALLPGPPNTVSVIYGGDPADLVTQTGTSGVTNSAGGAVVVAFGPTAQAGLGKALAWLPHTLAHEVDHSVRALAGPGTGFGVNLRDEIVSEGIASAFDEAAFTGPPNPYDRAISRSQECTLWRRAQPLLGQPDTSDSLYDQWFFGGGGVPHWTAFTIGYEILKDYLRLHPGTIWAKLTAATATAILAGSHYQPCSSASR
jgi:hypothetical protein